MMADKVPFVIGAVIVLLVQVFLAPHIAIGFAVPNFMLAYCLVFSVARPNLADPVLPFVMGLLYDLLSGGPVGAMAFTLTVACSLETSVFRRQSNDTAFMGVAVLLGGVLVAELVYGLFFLLFGYAASFPDALVYRVLPCFLYDTVIALALYLPFARLFGQGQGSAPLRSEIKQL